VGVFEAEAFQKRFRRSGGLVGVVLGRIDDEGRGIEHPDAAATADGGGGDVETFEKGGFLGEGAVALDVLVNGDAVEAARVPRRDGRIVLDAPPLIALDDFHSRRQRILEILHDPKASAFVEGNRHGAADGRFGEHPVEAKVVRGVELLPRLGRGQ
jgi:hypothetical protein